MALVRVEISFVQHSVTVSTSLGSFPLSTIVATIDAGHRRKNAFVTDISSCPALLKICIILQRVAHGPDEIVDPFGRVDDKNRKA